MSSFSTDPNTTVIDVVKAKTTVPRKRQHLQEMSQRGHFSLCCFSKDISLVREDDNPESEEDAFLGRLETQVETQWHIADNLNQEDVKFKLGTGKKITVISAGKSFLSLPNVKLKESINTLYWPARTALNVIRQFTGNFRCNNNVCHKLHDICLYTCPDMPTKVMWFFQSYNYTTTVLF